MLSNGGDDAVAELVLGDAVAPQPTATCEGIEILAGLDGGINVGLDEACRPQQGAFALAVLSALRVLLRIQGNVLECQHAAQNDAQARCKDQRREEADLSPAPPRNSFAAAAAAQIFVFVGPGPSPATPHVTVQTAPQMKGHAIAEDVAAVATPVLHFLELVIVSS